MPVVCDLRSSLGAEHCTRACPLDESEDVFRYARFDRASTLPPPEEGLLDVAVLDMNHGWPNLGHDSLVKAIRGTACNLREQLLRHGLAIRVISFDVRAGLRVPDADALDRFAVLVGTGGPGHLDPRRNDGICPESQGLREDPSWEPALFRLFDAVLADERRALLGVCHTFGLLCRWSGAAAPVVRCAEKGGKSSGVLENELSEEALSHPWFARFSRSLGGGRRLRILDSRLLDLVRMPGASGPPVAELGHEVDAHTGLRTDAVTMIEFARDRAGLLPRVFGVNHHPEILHRASLMALLNEKLERSEVSRDWYDERVRLMTTMHPGEDSEKLLALTSHFTLIAPLRFHLVRELRRRCEARGVDAGIHEDEVLGWTEPASS